MKIFSKNNNYEKYYKEFVPFMKREESQKYFYIILSISASIFFLIFAIKPTISTIANLKRQISDARLIEEKLSTKVRNLSSLSQQYQIIEPDIPLVVDAVPKNPQAPTLVGQIKKLGEENSVEISSIEILPVSLTTKSASKSSNFAFSITGTSEFSNTQKFLNDLVNMQRALTITSIQINTNTKVENQVDYIFKGSAYFKE